MLLLNLGMLLLGDLSLRLDQYHVLRSCLVDNMGLLVLNHLLRLLHLLLLDLNVVRALRSLSVRYLLVNRLLLMLNGGLVVLNYHLLRLLGWCLRIQLVLLNL